MRVFFLASCLFIPIMASCQIEAKIAPAFNIEKVISYDAPTEARYSQGMDIYNGYVFQGYSDGTVDVYDIHQRLFIQTIKLPKDENGYNRHCNDLFIQQIESNLVMWIPSNYLNSPTTGLSLRFAEGKYSLQASYVTIPSPILTNENTLKGSTLFFGNNSNYCIQVAYKETEEGGYGDTVIACYYYDVLSSSVKYSKLWEYQRERLWAMQGGSFLGDSFYLAVGVPDEDAKIYKFNLKDGTMDCYIDLRGDPFLLPFGEEMQGVSFYDGELYFSTTYGLYKIR